MTAASTGTAAPAAGSGATVPPAAGELTQEQQDLAASAAAFTRREIVPHLADWEEQGRIPRELHAAAARQDFLGVGFPEHVGGAGGDVLDSVAMQEGFFAAGASSGLMAGLLTGGIALPHLATRGSDALVETYVRPTIAGETIGVLGVTEPGGGSDVAGLTTRAERDGDSYVVTGEKTFITSGLRADFVTAAVRTGGPGADGLSLIVVDTDTPGFTASGPLKKMGWWCSDTATLSFDGVRVPAGNVVGEEGEGFAQLAEQFVTERLALAVHGYGIAARALALTAAYAKDRETFGKPLAGRQVVRHRLVEMHRQVEVARTYTRSVAARHAAGESVLADACLVKQTAVETATAVTDEAVQLHGGAGYLRESEVERHARDARILPIGGGATEVLTDLSARLLGYGS